jgi:hypothetical protein
MTNQHPITPPPELVTNWILESDIPGEDMCEGIATRAAQWGANQELEACCEWLRTESKTALWQTEALRTARRPKPPSLKEQALYDLDELYVAIKQLGIFNPPKTIRRALEALPE